MLTIVRVVCNCFNTTKKEFLCKYVTIIETWIHHLTPESNQQSAEWTTAGESHLKQPKTQTLAGKVLVSVFWDVQGILFINYLEKGRPINGEYYIALLMHLKEENHQTKATNEEEKSALSSRQCICHKLIVTMAKLHELHFELLLHPHNSPDLAPSDYWLFGDLKKMLQGKRFGSNE